MSTLRIALGAVNVEAADPQGLARFWAAVIGGPAPASTGGSVFVPAPGPGGFAMFFQPSTGPRPQRGTVHLDLTVPWGARAAEVDRTQLLGATWCWDVLDQEPHVRWTTLRDPEGNLFCLAEHPPAGSG